jgi:hypothetical protein
MGIGATAPVGSQRHQSSLKNLPGSWSALGPGCLIHAGMVPQTREWACGKLGEIVACH